MSDTLARVQALVAARDFVISLHADRELEADGISERDAVAGVAGAIVVEDYPTFAKGPAVLVLQRDRDGLPIHLVWGIRTGTSGPRHPDNGIQAGPLAVDGRLPWT